MVMFLMALLISTYSYVSIHNMYYIHKHRKVLHGGHGPHTFITS